METITTSGFWNPNLNCRINLKLILGIVLSLLFKVKAQNFDITGIKSVRPTDVKAIMENNQIKGYYAFCFLDRANKKENFYVLNILDNNLKLTHRIELSIPTKTQLLESSYNSNRFCFSFLNKEKKALEYLLYDKTGKSVGKYSTAIDFSELEYYSSGSGSSDDLSSGALAAIKGKGFVRFGYRKTDGVRMEIELFDNEGQLVWNTNFNAKTKRSYESFTPLHVDTAVIAVLVAHKDKIELSRLKYTIVLINPLNGNEITRLEYNKEDHTYLPLCATYNESNKSYFVFGQYFNIKDNVSMADPKGVFVQEIKADGSILKEANTDWKKTIAPLLAKKGDVQPEKNMKTFIHKIVTTADGKVFAIGEQYKKNINTERFIPYTKSYNNYESGIIIELYNMLVLEFDNTFTLSNYLLVEKAKSNVSIPAGYGFHDTNILGNMLKQWGYFDYNYTVISNDQKVFNSAFTNFDRNADASNRFNIGNISYTRDQKLVVDKFPLKSKPDYFYILQAKPGYVAVLEFFMKEKKALIRLEKLDL